jgi:DNA-binding CsgD family transcriptional regulator
MGGVAEKGAERLVQFSVFRGAARNAFEPAEERAMTALWPAIRLATRVALQVGALKREAAVLSDTLDARPERIVLVDARGAVVAVNTSAQALLAGDGPLRIVRRRLTGRRQQETAAIAGLLSAAATPGADPASVILRGSDGAAALRLSAVPLAEAARVRRGGQPSEAPAAAVFLDVPGATGRVCPSTAMALYGLTRTQARLAAALANGATLQQTAGDLGIAPGTARTHLKAVFQKTGTRRQPDLVALLLSDASALP